MITLLTACNEAPTDTSNNGFEFSDQWLQLSNFYTDTCFYLDSEERNVVIYDKDAAASEVKDWAWEFYPPELFVIDERDLIVIKDDECWYLEAYGITSEACDCTLRIPSDN